MRCFDIFFVATRWRYQMEPFSALLALCAGNSPFTGHQWIPPTKASKAGLWYFLWSTLKQTVEQTIETPVIWDSNTLSMTSLWDSTKSLLKPEIDFSPIWSSKIHVDGFMQERCNPRPLAMELWLSCNNPLIWHYSDVIMSTMASRLKSAVNSGADERN